MIIGTTQKNGKRIDIDVVRRDGKTYINNLTLDQLHEKYEKCFKSDGNVIESKAYLERYYDSLSEAYLNHKINYDIKKCRVEDCPICGNVRRVFKLRAGKITVISSKQRKKMEAA